MPGSWSHLLWFQNGSSCPIAAFCATIDNANFCLVHTGVCVEYHCMKSHQLWSLLLAASTSAAKHPPEWMQREIAIPHFVYFNGGTNETHKHEDIAWESPGYLTFIAEYYDCLPRVSLSSS